jgi:hypothetical protein
MNYFNDSKNFGTEIVFRSLCKLHFVFADSHVQPDTKLWRRDKNTLSQGLHPTPYCEDVRIGHSRMWITCGRVNCVIVSLDKFRQNVNIYVSILVREKSVQSISDRIVSMFHDRIFHIGFFTNLKLNALIT